MVSKDCTYSLIQKKVKSYKCYNKVLSGFSSEEDSEGNSVEVSCTRCSETGVDNDRSITIICCQKLMKM